MAKLTLRTKEVSIRVRDTGLQEMLLYQDKGSVSMTTIPRDRCLSQDLGSTTKFLRKFGGTTESLLLDHPRDHI